MELLHRAVLKIAPICWKYAPVLRFDLFLRNLELETLIFNLFPKKKVLIILFLKEDDYNSEADKHFLL